MISVNPFLADKSVVIVGGTTGLGLSAAKACAEAGARLVLVGRDERSAADACAAIGDSATALVGDATNPETAARAIESALERHGRFDGLYHVAGGSGRAAGDGPLDRISDDGWDFTIQQNLTSLFYSNRAAATQLLKQRDGGSVLNLASVLAFSPAPRHFATHAYAAAKAAIVGLTRSAAAYYAPRQIRFNVLAPALIRTPMSERACGNPEIMDYVRRKQPLGGGRIGEPSDLDFAVVYFLSDQSRFVTGQSLAIDGGWSVTEVGGQAAAFVDRDRS